MRLRRVFSASYARCRRLHSDSSSSSRCYSQRGTALMQLLFRRVTGRRPAVQIARAVRTQARSETAPACSRVSALAPPITVKPYDQENADMRVAYLQGVIMPNGEFVSTLTSFFARPTLMWGPGSS